ncbi:MAG: alpha-2-macroglobulin [Elusimicrobiota bacterium]|nr:alpha-2-macroglobulin [Elusimicrobiota bacterium]
MEEQDKTKTGTNLFFLGKIAWEPPHWFNEARTKLLERYRTAVAEIGGEVRKNPKRSLRILLLTVTGVLVFACGIYWYVNRPVAARLTVSGTAPGLTKIEDTIVPDPIYIDFGGSAARLDQIGKKAESDISITPQLKGEWTWVSDRQLKFTPAEDWAIGRRYTVKMEKKLFPQHVSLEKYEHEFTTPAFDYSITKSEFYIDPQKPDMKKVVATISFTHPVDAGDFEKRVHLRMEGQRGGFLGLGGDKDYPSVVFYNKYKTEAYIHSDSVRIPAEDTYMLLNIDDGVRPGREASPSKKQAEAKVVVPGMYSYFRLSSAELTLVRNERYEPEQVLVLQASAGVLEAEIQSVLEVYELPVDYPALNGEPAVKYYSWGDPARIGPEVMALSTRLKLEPLPTDREYATLHSFKYKSQPGRYVYAKVKKGLKCYGDFILARDFEYIARVPEFPKELKIMADGSILSLSGEKKLSLVSRDIDAIRFQIGRVIPNQINHLVSQSGGDIKLPEFNNWNFGEDNITEKFSEIRPLNKVEYGKTQYSSFDLSGYMDGDAGGGAKRGLFFFAAEGWDPVRKVSLGVADKRLILVTDLGIVVKDSKDGGRDVFVQSIHSGQPASMAQVQVIGKNGLAVVSAAADEDGHASFPSLKGFDGEKNPTVYVVRKGADLSFLPYNWSSRQLGFSRFDVGGARPPAGGDSLQAYLFSDRGIYRPGDEFHIGAIIRSGEWGKDISGIPLEAVVTDSRGLEIMKEKFSLPAAGFQEVKYKTEDNSPTGSYQVQIYIIKDNRRANLLGSASVKIEEFLPDRMTITTKFSEAGKKGWVPPAGLKGVVSLKNLFGTPAQNRRVKASVTLSPSYPAFKEYPEHLFFDPLRAKNSFSDSLEAAKTDDKGEAEFELGLEKFEKATYRVNFAAEGYEAEGGRGVVSESSMLVSPLPYLVGYKADGDMKYISKGSDRFVNIVGVGPELDKVEVPGLKLKIVELKYVSALIQQPDRTYKYQSVEKEVQISKADFKIPEKGIAYKLPTGQSGSFSLVLSNQDNLELCRIPFYVAGSANLERSLDRNAELEVRLDKDDYAGGETIEIQIKAPYSGAGLITIERDRVYAHKWFKTSTTATTARIQLPPGMQGNGYINVTFLRAPDSPEIFMSPLSYGVVPFTISRKKLTEPITLECTELALPGKPLRIKYSTAKAGKIVIFAVDEGILQVARYKTPDPLSYFFEKKALEVDTWQILDLILPEFEMVRRLSAPGGDAGFEAIGKNLNPFKRKREKPAVYWSGIINADSVPREVVYEVPDYFNGSLKIMAVAVTPYTVGVAEKKTVVRGPFVLTPNVPMAVSPGDVFDVSVGVANNVEGSGKNSKLSLELSPSGHLAVQGQSKVEINVSEGGEGSARFTVKALDNPGSATLKFRVFLGEKESKSSVDISLRPAAPYVTSVTGGYVKDGKAEVPVERRLYPDFRILEAAYSTVPLGLARGLVNYLNKFPHGCTEQLVSQAFPAIVLLNRAEFGYAPDKVRASMEQTIKVLRSRQNAEGAFGFWAANSHYSEFQTVYALHFLTEAKEKGYPVPAELLSRGLSFLGGLLGSEAQTLNDARARAYAAYVLTRNGIVISGALGSLRQQLETKMRGQWETDLAAVYLAAAYKIMKQNGDAERIMKKCRLGDAQASDYGFFYDGLVRDAQLLYIMARHFPEKLEELRGDDILKIVNPVIANQYNTLSSAYVILAFDAYAGTVGAPKAEKVSLSEMLIDGGSRTLGLPGGMFPVSTFSDKAKTVRIANGSDYNLFYQVTAAGFDLKPPQTELKNKLEVQREYRAEDGQVTDKVKVGANLEVHVKIRAIAPGEIQNVAIVDMLPGGFEVVLEPSLRETAAPAPRRREAEGDGEEYSEGETEAESPAPGGWRPDYVDVREDRVVIYGSAGADAREFVYKIRATNAGAFTTAPVFAESMYDRNVQARSLAGNVKIEQ